MVSKISTAAQLHQAETATYMTDAVIGIAFVILIIIAANMISWQPGAHDNSPAKRRVWFWILAATCLFTNIGVDYYMWMSRIGKVQFVNEYLIHMIAAAAVSTLVYGVITFIICKLQKKDSKLAFFK